MNNLVKLQKMRKFISTMQLDIMLLNNEERSYHLDLICEWFDKIAEMPVSYETDGEGMEAIAHLHYFMGGNDWYITEIDTDHSTPQLQAYGRVSLNGNYSEQGYISIVDLIRLNVEFDLYFEPKKLKDL